MIAPDVLTDWLLESLEAMTDTERNALASTAKAKAAKALEKAIKDLWKPRPQKDLAAAAGIDPSTLSALKTDGFDSDSNSALKIANTLRINFRKLCEGKVELAASNATPAGSLADEVRKFEGTPDEPFIREFLSRLKR